MRRALCLALALAAGTPARADTADALARLVEIDATAASPDGRWVVYRTRAPDPQANRYTLSWHLVPAAGGAPRALGDGGDIELRTDADGHVVGTITAPQPSWSPDSRHVLLPQRRDGARELWLAGPGVAARPLFTGDRDVGPAHWLDAERVAVDLADEPRAARAARLAAGARDGHRYGADFRPGWQPRPRVAPPAFTTRAVMTIDGRPSPVALPPTPALPEPGAQLVTPGAHPAWARLADPALAGPMAPMTVVAGGARGASIPCPDPRCTGQLTGLWRRPDGQLLFLRREGPNLQGDGLYRWRPGAARVSALRLPPDAALDRCTLAALALVCVLETPTVPGRLVRIDEHGVTELVDPNPGFAVRATVERLEWDGPWGRQFGHLVLPTGLAPGKKAPLVVVQYRSRGFLRGGVGDEYPILALADAGLAVLSFDRPNALDRLQAIADPDELVRRIIGREVEDRPQLFAGLEQGLDLALRTGRIDGTRLGISGLSDGAVMTMHALLHSRRFKAAAISSPVWDPIGYFVTDAATRADYVSGGLTDPFIWPGRWRELSPALNVERIATPLLLQLADRELVASAQLLDALSRAAKPHEAYVFEDEYHIKWQPAHRLAVYRRTVDWFSFWLKEEEEADPPKRDQYARWRAMKAARGR